MTKLILRTILIGGLFLALGCQHESNSTEKNDWEKSNLKGKIKSMKYTLYSGLDNFGKLKRLSINLEELYKYNKSGYLTESIVNDHSNNTGYLIRNVYEKNTVMKETVKYDGEGDMINRKLFFHDAEGKLIKEKFFHRDDFFNEVTIYEYDSYGNRIEEIVKEPDEKEIQKTFSYKYNSDRQLIEKSYNFDKNLIIYYTYDINGNVKVEHGVYKKNDTETFKYSYLYFENGKLKQEKIEEGDYGKNHIKKYEYDKFGNQTSLRTFNLNKELESHYELGYKFDDNNNWIFRTQYDVKNGGIREAFVEKVREIEYYENE